MVGKSPRKRAYVESPSMNDTDIGGLVSEGKRLRFQPEPGGEDLDSGSPGGSDKGELDLMLDSGSDCVPMESSSGGHPVDEEEEEEGYIDVVSEDSAIQEEDIIEDDYGMDEAGYPDIHHIAHMDNLISSHDDSAIIKSEIFDPAYDEMHQMLVSSAGDYEQTFLNGVESSGLLDLKTDSDMSLTQEEITMSLKETMMEHPPVDSIQTEIETPVTTTCISNLEDVTSTSALCTTANGVSIQASLMNTPGILPTLPQPLVNINNLNAASVLGSNAPVLTTPVFLAQGAPGPAGQTNSIITTHLARLVPSPDGKGYILHLGLNPSAPATNTTPTPASAAATSSTCVMTSCTGPLTTNNNNGTSSSDSPNTSPTTVLPIIPPPAGGGSAITPKSPQQQTNTSGSVLAAGPATSSSSNSIVGGLSVKPSVTTTGMPLVSPNNLNITITPATSSAAVLQRTSPTTTKESQGSPGGSSMSSLNSSPDIGSSPGRPGSQVSPMQVVESSVKEGSVSPRTEEIVSSVSHLMSSQAMVNSLNTSSAQQPQQAIVSHCMNSVHVDGVGSGANTSMAINGNATAIEVASASAALLDNNRQLLEQHLAAQQQQQQSQQQQAQLLQQQPLASQQPQPRSKSKRRNSKELRELMELEQIASKPGGDTDRFVICSDGEMNCALCGFNTSDYSSFKSHIICSHPCWRITKKLSRNRLLVEKSVKVSVPVANFSVPNPVPAVPIQPRVQSKKNKKEVKETKEKASKANNDNDSSSSSKKEDTVKSSGKRKESANTCNSFVNDIPPLDTQVTEGKRRIYKCTRCLKLFVSEEMTVNHIVDVHNVKKPYTCIEVSNDYGKSFSTIYRCPQKNCTFSCESITSLERHKNEVHTQQAVYRCQICGYSADSTKAVNEHAVKIHRQQVMMYGLSD